MPGGPAFEASRHGLKIFRGGIDLLDYKGRTVHVGDRGMEMRDRSGNVIHDTPDFPIGAGRKYLGHVIWFTDNSNYVLYNAVTAVNTWTDVTCVTDGNSNVQGAIIRFQHYSNGRAAGASTGAQMSLRPKGTTWTVGGALPLFSMSVSAGGNYLTDYLHAGMAIVPLGADNKFQFYIASLASVDVSMKQLGMLI